MFCRNVALFCGNVGLIFQTRNSWRFQYDLRTLCWWACDQCLFLISWMNYVKGSVVFVSEIVFRMPILFCDFLLVPRIVSCTLWQKANEPMNGWDKYSIANEISFSFPQEKRTFLDTTTKRRWMHGLGILLSLREKVAKWNFRWYCKLYLCVLFFCVCVFVCVYTYIFTCRYNAEFARKGRKMQLLLVM